MKLKKIASLMLAGIMAVSMLAGCKSGTPDPDDNGGASSNTTSSFTQSVLSKTNAKTKALLGASDNAKLDNAIAATAAVDTGDAHRDQVMSILWATSDEWGSVKKAISLMNGAEEGFRNSTEFAGFNVNENATMWKDAPITYWTLGIASSTVDDNTIAELIADELDKLVAADKIAVSNDNYTYDYDVRVAKSVCKNTKLNDADDDYIIVGVALTCNREAVKY